MYFNLNEVKLFFFFNIKVKKQIVNSLLEFKMKTEKLAFYNGVASHNI